jgi:hypothetical protein
MLPSTVYHIAAGGLAMLSRFRSTTKKSLLGLLLGVSALASAETQIVPVMARAPGAGGSDWRSTLLVTDTSGNGASGEILVLPLGQSTPEESALRVPYSLPARGAAEIDVLGSLGYTGAATLLVTGENVGAVARYWNQRPDGTQLSQLLNASPRTEMLQPGDVALFTLPSEGFRFNLFLYGEKQSLPMLPATMPQINAELYGMGGTYKTAAIVDLLDHGAKQFAPATNGLFGRDAQPQDTIKVTVTGGLVEMVGSPVQNNGGNDDGGSQRPIVNRLLKDGSVRSSPLQAEQNDTYHLEVSATSRPGTQIESMTMDVDGNGQEEYTVFAENPANTFYFKESGPLGIAPGTYTPQVLLLINDNNSRYYRHLTASPFTVKAEQNGYIASYDNAKTFIMNNLELASNWSSHGAFDGQMYNSDVWKTAWPKYFDGISSSSNPEAEYFIFRDVGDSMTGNDLQLKLIGGNTQAIMGLPENEFDEFRVRMKAELPSDK